MVKLKFYGTERSETGNTSLEGYVNAWDELYIYIETDDYPASYICLDKATAIKFVKSLKAEISKMGNNG